MFVRFLVLTPFSILILIIWVLSHSFFSWSITKHDLKNPDMTIFWPRGIHSRWRLELCIIRLHSKWMISRDYPYAAAWFSIDSLCSAICSADEKELGLSSWNKIDSHKLAGHFQIPKSPITSFIDSSCEDSTNVIPFYSVLL